MLIRQTVLALDDSRELAATAGYLRPSAPTSRHLSDRPARPATISAYVDGSGIAATLFA